VHLTSFLFWKNTFSRFRSVHHHE